MTNKDIYVKNRYGLWIKKCCASCQSKKYNRKKSGCTVVRICQMSKDLWKGEKGLCASWMMDMNLTDIGHYQSDVKKPEYIAFVVGWRLGEYAYLDSSRIADMDEVEESYNFSYKNRQSDATRRTYYHGWRYAEERLVNTNKQKEASASNIREQYMKVFGDVFLKLD